jgi:hypothetical protein
VRVAKAFRVIDDRHEGGRDDETDARCRGAETNRRIVLCDGDELGVDLRQSFIGGADRGHKQGHHRSCLGVEIRLLDMLDKTARRARWKEDSFRSSQAANHDDLTRSLLHELRSHAQLRA